MVMRNDFNVVARRKNIDSSKLISRKASNQMYFMDNSLIEEANCFLAKYQGFDCGELIEDCLITRKEFNRQVTL